MGNLSTFIGSSTRGVQHSRLSIWSVNIRTILIGALGLVVSAESATLNQNGKRFTLATLVSAENSNFVARAQNGLLTPEQRWNLNTGVGAYETVGQRSAKWDGDAIEALETFAFFQGMLPGKDRLTMERRIGLAANKARSLGCTDPMIQYLWLRLGGFAPRDPKSMFAAPDYEGCARDLAKSDYPGIRKFFGCMRAIDTYLEMRQSQPEFHSLVDMAGSFLKEALTDKEMPQENAYDNCERFLRACRQAKSDSHAAWTKLEPQIKESLGETYYSALLEGLADLQWAWAARGTGFANTVTEEGQRLMTERLALSHRALDRAWRLNPKDWRGPNLMMEVEFLESYDYDRMEKWFQRAMQNNPDNYAACAIKLNFMALRWGGSEKALVTFARQCLTNTIWTPEVAEIVPKAYGEIVVEIRESDERMDFWRRAEVWSDIKAAYEKLFQAYPKTLTLREDFARYGFLCGQKEEAERILRALPPKSGSGPA